MVFSLISIFYKVNFSNKLANSDTVLLPNQENNAKPTDLKTENNKSQATVKEAINKPVSIPEETGIIVPFIVQAPNANWDQIHEEACEEASLLMIKHFLNNSSIKTVTEADKEILELIDFESKTGYQISIALKELSEIAEKHYGLKKGRVETNITIEQIKKELAEDKPVIVPAAGKILPNPNFRNGGPLYHMLVIKGYDKNGFITNDPGTRNGEGFRYTFDALFNAIHDWDKEDILKGQKAYLVFD